MSKLKIFTDGASRGNPGVSGIGIVMRDSQGKLVKEIYEHIGNTTNNIAEYTALVKGLQVALEMGFDRIEVFSDSELMVRQINGVYKVRNAGLKPLYEKACDILGRFKLYKINHIRREFNKEADRLANIGIEEELERLSNS